MDLHFSPNPAPLLQLLSPYQMWRAVISPYQVPRRVLDIPLKVGSQEMTFFLARSPVLPANLREYFQKLALGLLRLCRCRMNRYPLNIHPYIHPRLHPYQHLFVPNRPSQPINEKSPKCPPPIYSLPILTRHRPGEV